MTEYNPISEHELLTKAVLVLSIGVVAQWAAWRLRMPSIVLLSVFGVLAGPVFGFVHPPSEFGEISGVLVKLAVAVILFEGGLNLRFFELKRAGQAVRRLVIFGLPISWVLGTVACYYVAGLSLPVSLVLASILVVTGPTVIMPLIRQTKLTPRSASLLKWEGIVNDPLGVLLAVFVFEYIISRGGTTSPSFGIIYQILLVFAVSSTLGLGAAYFVKFTFNRGYIPESLKVPVVLCIVFAIFGLSNQLQDEAGLLAVTVFGFTLGNIGLLIIDELRRFKEYITVFLVSAVFIILTASLEPKQLAYLNYQAVLFVLALLFLVRPISVFIATMRTNLTWQEKTLIGWIAPRGVVAASMGGLFAPKLLAAGYDDADTLVPLIFFVVFTTVICHGFSFPWLAKKLNLASNQSEGIVIVGGSPWTTNLAVLLKKMNIPVLIVDSSWHHLKDARNSNIPVYYGEILSERGEATLDFSQMGYILAATDNDAYNALTCNTFAAHFGRDRVYQLPMHRSTVKESKVLKVSNRGRFVFNDDLQFEGLMTNYYRGWRFKHTQITKEFDFQSFVKQSADRAVPVILIRKNGHLIIEIPEKPVAPDPDDILISFSAPEKSLA